MTNTKSKKGDKSSAQSTFTNVSSGGELLQGLDRVGHNLFQIVNGGSILSEDTEVDDEECINDSDTGTSFSLEECMNEFRARRIRRVSLHSRQDVDRVRDENNRHDVSEVDLIHQNQCNKEHERKCKPCKDGFCYCFTSDSGDGACNAGRMSACRDIPATQTRHYRRYKRSQNEQVCIRGDSDNMH